MVVLGQKCMNFSKVLYSGKSGCIGEKVVVFEQKRLYSGKVVEIGKKLLYSCRVVVLGQK